ncbi:MAG: hypothetical protein AAB296_01660 [Candidatus Desantisbacteria bacterium]
MSKRCGECLASVKVEIEAAEAIGAAESRAYWYFINHEGILVLHLVTIILVYFNDKQVNAKGA